MSCFLNWVYKSKHIHDNNLVMDSWSVNDYHVKADTYAGDGGLRISGRSFGHIRKSHAVEFAPRMKREAR